MAIKSLELHYPMFQVLINTYTPNCRNVVIEKSKKQKAKTKMKKPNRN